MKRSRDNQMAAIISKYSNAHIQRVPLKSLINFQLVHLYRLALFQGAQIPADEQLQLESQAQLLALSVEGNTYSQFHGTCPFLQRNCERFNSPSFRLLGGGRSRLPEQAWHQTWPQNYKENQEDSNIRFRKKGSLLTPLMVKMTVIVSVRSH